ncbi:SH2 domain-containing protein [Aphelenchoides besseyi]|nr:SH2 domain-containing protein [Aphelenchoides besseyi]KAI6195517.1 SH2 domain-containing protein [Aphelenchoides besseyi]
MEEAQYDIPWELQTRNNFSALRTRPHSTNEAGTSGMVKVSPPLIMHQSASPNNQLNNSTSPSTSGSTPSPSAAEQRVRSAYLPSAQFRSTSNYPKVQIESKRSPQTTTFDPQAAFWNPAQPPIPAPRHQLHYQNQSPMISTGTSNSQDLNAISLNTPLANRRHRLHFDESTMVHEQMDRVEAEKRLEPKQVGDYLLRRRNDGTLAMSLRATDSVLHIKLERRDKSWVLGEGPAFRTVGTILRFYARTELPIRGAEHVRLLQPILTGN